jgi:hypothetical protein
VTPRRRSPAKKSAQTETATKRSTRASTEPATKPAKRLSKDPPTLPSATAVGNVLLPGPRTVAGASITTAAIQRLDLDPKIKAQLVKSLAEVLPGRPIASGRAAADRTLGPDVISAMIPSAAISAAGFDPATVDQPAPNALWRNGNQQLLVRVSGVRANLGDGLIEIVVPVNCDQTGDVDISVSFVTGAPDRPAGGIATTEDHPRGPAVIVENWAEPLIAYAWQTLVTATSALSSAAGSDTIGRNLVTASLAITAQGLTVTPMGQHTFLAGVTPQ